MSSQRQHAVLNAALDYAAMGWPVFPCKPDKTPYTAHGFHDASCEPATIARWWARHTNAMIGIPTGKASGFVVLDVDPDKGGADSLDMLCTMHSALPDTVQSITQSRGSHFLFACPPWRVQNSEGELAPGLDVRGDGGYIIAPPSQHASGASYEWELSSYPDTTPLAPLPAWLAAIIKAIATPKRRASKSYDQPIEAGQRQVELFKFACMLRGKGANEDVIFSAVAAMNTSQCRPPLDSKEVHHAAESALRYEQGQLSALDNLAALPSNGTQALLPSNNATLEDDNPFLQEAIEGVMGLQIRRIIQQGVSDAHYSVEFSEGLVPIGSARQFLDQATWRGLILNHGETPFARLKEKDWLRVVSFLRSMTTVEDKEIGTAEWLHSVMLGYVDSKALTWGSTSDDADILLRNAPFYRKDILHVHAEHLHQWIMLLKKGSLSRGLLLGTLRALHFHREEVKARTSEGKQIKRFYWAGVLEVPDNEEPAPEVPLGPVSGSKIQKGVPQ